MSKKAFFSSNIGHYLMRKIPLIVSLAVGLTVSLLFTLFLGENPVNVAAILMRSAFGSREDIAQTLFYTTPLIFTGLSVGIAYQAGLFNIGAEGQLTLAAFMTTVVGVLVPGLPWWIAVPVSIAVSFVSGAFLGFLSGYLKAMRGAHEVITTILFNFIVTGLTSYGVLYWIKNPENPNPETMTVGPGYQLPRLLAGDGVYLNFTFVIAIATVFVIYFLFNKTRFGFELKAVGQSYGAAKTYGIFPKKIQIQAMALAGGVAGLVALNEILGSAYKFRIGFSPGYGFLGIAVALLGGGNPIGIFGAALLFGILHKGTLALDMETDAITKDFSYIIQAILIFVVASRGGLRKKS